MERTLALIKCAHKGDKEARDTVFKENQGLIYSVAKRFLGRGVEMEDLIQIGSIGLLKAIDKFNFEFNVKFSTYAVPMIAGEIKRFLRDDGMIKISRSIKETFCLVKREIEGLEKELGREPTIIELSEKLKLPAEEIAMAMEASMEVESLQKTLYQGEGTEILLEDKIFGKTDLQEELLNKLLLEDGLKNLTGNDKKLIVLRYFQNKTQMETATILGVSQVQVSRLEKRILKELRKRML